MKLQVLDCTLRDGAYIVDAKFGDNVIKGVIKNLDYAGIELVECGWLKNDNHKSGSSYFNSPDDLIPYLPKDKHGASFVLMMDYGRYDLKNLPDYKGYTDFANLLKTKAYTHTRITRSLCHVMLDIQKEHMNTYLSHGICFYAKALGFKRSAAPLLKALKSNSSIPLITKLSQAAPSLSSIGRQMLQQDLRTSELYHGRPAKKGPAYNEYTRPLIIL